MRLSLTLFRIKRKLQLLSVFVLLNTAGISFASCERTLQAPAWNAGQSIIVRNSKVSGILPKLFSEEVKKVGCEINFVSVPPSRAAEMFKNGTADLLMLTFKTPLREELGEFIPLIQGRAQLISLDQKHSKISTIQQLLTTPEIHLMLVRGYDFGADYQQLVVQLQKQGRITFQPDALSVARMMKRVIDGRTIATIMAPTVFYAAIFDDDRVGDMVDKLRLEPLNELPWAETGTYLSKFSMQENDRQLLRSVLNDIAQSNAYWKEIQSNYPARFLKESMRPIEKNH
ncbi:MAG: hypothetical protein K2Y28_06320 [Burkholderiaceae bacterium]|nr:hypothetical protein [Burkholderiaceae bacterium]